MVGLRSLVRDFLTELVDRKALDSLVRFCKPEKAILSIRLLEVWICVVGSEGKALICSSCGSLDLLANTVT